jgi:hypothetical protein
MARNGDCKPCLGGGWFCSNCERPGVSCDCDDVERGSADEDPCDACEGSGWAREDDDDVGVDVVAVGEKGG